MAERLVRVWEVTVDLANQFAGPAGDGMQTVHFRACEPASDFAKGHTCWGKPATVTTAEVSVRLARRWGCA